MQLSRGPPSVLGLLDPHVLVLGAKRVHSFGIGTESPLPRYNRLNLLFDRYSKVSNILPPSLGA